MYLLPEILVSELFDLGNSPSAERGVGEWTMRCGDNIGAPAGFSGFGLGNKSERSMRGGRSLRLESLVEFFELREMDEGAGLPSVGLSMVVVVVVESRELK